jgi:hypothetical protein
VDRLVQRALGRRRVSLVYVDAATFAGAAGSPKPELQRLRAAGVPVVVLRRGDDLAAKLGDEPLRSAAHA